MLSWLAEYTPSPGVVSNISRTLNNSKDINDRDAVWAVMRLLLGDIVFQYKQTQVPPPPVAVPPVVVNDE